jgi:hypothetical protein
MSSRVYDTKQDNIRNKVEKIKASITLPFQPFLETCEMVSTQHSLNSKEVPTSEDLQIEASKVIGSFPWLALFLVPMLLKFTAHE